MTTLTTNEWGDDASDDVVIIYDFNDYDDDIDDIDQRTNDCEDDAGDDKEDSDGDRSAGVPQASSCDPAVETMLMIECLLVMVVKLLEVVIQIDVRWWSSPPPATTHGERGLGLRAPGRLLGARGEEVEEGGQAAPGDLDHQHDDQWDD